MQVGLVFMDYGPVNPQLIRILKLYAHNQGPQSGPGGCGYPTSWPDSQFFRLHPGISFIISEFVGTSASMLPRLESILLKDFAIRRLWQN